MAGAGVVGIYMSDLWQKWSTSDKGIAALDASDPVHPYKRTVYVMRGVPGSGKSTVAHSILRRHLLANGITGPFDAIAPLCRGFILSTDDFFSRVDEETGMETTVYDMTQIKRNHERNRIRCEIAMELGISPVIVDNTNTCAWEMRPYVELAQSHGYNVIIKDVHEKQELTFEVIKERIAGRRSSTGKDVPLAAVERLLKRYEKLPPDPEAAVTHILQSQPPWLAAEAKKASAATVTAPA